MVFLVVALVVVEVLVFWCGCGDVGCDGKVVMF